MELLLLLGGGLPTDTLSGELPGTVLLDGLFNHGLTLYLLLGGELPANSTNLLLSNLPSGGGGGGELAGPSYDGSQQLQLLLLLLLGFDKSEQTNR